MPNEEMNPLLRAVAEIDLEALAKNYRTLLERAREGNPAVRAIAVVKKDAYGHSLPLVLPTLLALGCDFFAVATAEEALCLRTLADRYGKHPDILILGPTLPGDAPRLARADIILSLYSPELARALSQAAERNGLALRLHVKADVGMNRIGFPAHSEEEILRAGEEIAAAVTLPGLSAEGIFMHFSSADREEPRASSVSFREYSRFSALLSLLCEKGIDLPFVHTSNSSATLRYPGYVQNGVRLGIALYGVPPSENLSPSSLCPVMALKTAVVHLHTLLPGEGVGYGGCYRPPEERRIATLPIGYGDGFLCAYTGASVRIRTAAGECSAPIVGRICMDQCMIDVTGLPVKLYDEVVLFGEDENRSLHALSERTGMIPYEILSTVGGRIERRKRR